MILAEKGRIQLDQIPERTLSREKRGRKEIKVFDSSEENLDSAWRYSGGSAVAVGKEFGMAE